MLDPEIEASLRLAAPELPANLKRQTLARCVAEIGVAQRAKQRGRARLVWALTALCALQFLWAYSLDAQRSALLPRGSSHAARGDLVASRPDSTPSENWRLVIAARSHLIANLLIDKTSSPATVQPD